MHPGDGSGAFFSFFTKALEPHLCKEQPAQDRQGTTALEMSDMGCQALMGCPGARSRGPSGGWCTDSKGPTPGSGSESLDQTMHNPDASYKNLFFFSGPGVWLPEISYS